MERLRFWQIAILLFVILLLFFGLIIWKADALTKNACQICSAKMGEAVTCYTQSGMGIISRTYLPNYSVINGVS